MHRVQNYRHGKIVGIIFSRTSFHFFYGQSFGVSTHWVLAAIIPSLVPFLFNLVGAGVVFAFFAFMMVLQLIFVHFIMPETKGISLEDLSKKLIKDN